MDLAAAIPCNEMASSGYCLAKRGSQYLAYLPDDEKVAVDISDASGELTVEWFSIDSGETANDEVATGGARHEFTSPFGNNVVLFLQVR